MSSVISVRNLSKSYKDNHVLKDVNFEVKKGTIYALLGSNGAGKTTAINILTTLLMPDSGEVKVAGFDVVREDKRVRKSISLTGQFAAVDDLLTGEENLIMMGRFSHVDPKVVRQRSSELLQQLDLVKAAKRPISTYSGGMRRRLDLAISLLASPPIIFLDEPTTGLDPRSRQEIWKIIKQLVSDGATIFLTTQYLEEADQLADRVAVLHEGVIVAEGTSEELKRQVGGELIQLTFEDEATMRDAQKIIDGEVTAADIAHYELEVATDGSAKNMRELLDKLVKHHIEPTKIKLRQPTLDDAFMQLTEKKGN